MRVLVTGAEGFAGQWVVRELLAHGHQVTGAIRLGGTIPPLPERDRVRVDWQEFDLLSLDTVDRLAARRTDAVLHLAAVASGADARQDPGHAWTVNAAGTARLCEAFGRRVAEGASDPLFVLVSTGEVYGQGTGEPRRPDDALAPCSPYAASKAAAELAAQEVARRTGLRVVVARAFPHTGPGQSEKYALPAIASRLRTARRIGAPVIKTGNLDPVRDYLDVRDVAAAYRHLAERGRPGAVYNVASGSGHALRELVDRMAALLGLRVIVEPDPALARANDLRHLVGDASSLRRDTGWVPAVPLEQTLRDLLDAQAD